MYRGLPGDVNDPAALPVVDKRRLMAAFDDWVTDPAITLERARAFADDPAMIGRPFAGRYTLTPAPTPPPSGTRSRPG